MAVISIVIPIFQVEKYLVKCITSILSQTYSDFSLILVDDGSMDSCAMRADEYSLIDDRIIVVHKRNGGLSSARNIGIDISNGEYIYFCDSDDRIDSKLLEEILNEARNTSADMVRFNYKIENEQNELVDSYLSCRDTSFDLETDKKRFDFLNEVLLARKIGWSAWGCLLRLDIIKANNLYFADNKMIFAEDLYFSCLYSLYARKVRYVDKCLYYYYLRTDSIIGKLETSKFPELCKLSETLYAHVESDYIRDYYASLHHKIIFTKIKGVYEYSGISNAIALADDAKLVENKDFFMKMNQKYLKSTVYNNIPSFWERRRTKLVDSYLATMKYSSFIYKIKMLHFLEKCFTLYL